MRRSLDSDLKRWLDEGLITAAQAEAIRGFEAVDEKALSQEETPAPTPSARPALRAGAREWRPRRSEARPGNRFVHAVVNPPFARRPPFFVNGRWVGAVALGLAALGLFAALLTLSTDLLLAPGRIPGEILGLSIQVLAASLGLGGGYLMLSRHRRGKRLVVASLALDVVANALPDPRHLLHTTSLLQILLWIVLYYLVVVSRYERVAASVA